MTESVISVRGLVNRFGDSVVHEGLDLDVRQGEMPMSSNASALIWTVFLPKYLPARRGAGVAHNETFVPYSSASAKAAS